MDPAESDFGVLLAVAHATFLDRLHRHMEELGFEGFTTRTGFVLRVLSSPGEDQALSLREIADVLEMSSPAALKVVDAMVREGYVERVAGRRDRRVRAVTPTERGRAALAAARKFHADFEQSLGAAAPDLRAGLGLIAGQASAAIPRVLRRPTQM
ncbi:MAG: MarR family transcriptional regulator [Nocardioides sp.]